MDIDYAHVKRHENMWRLPRMPAVFERGGRGRSVGADERDEGGGNADHLADETDGPPSSSTPRL